MAITLDSLTTELDAVNAMLDAIGEDYVNTLVGESVADVAVARSTLARASRLVQARGWHFNSEEDYPLIPALNGIVVIPANVLRIDTTCINHPGLDVVVRGQKLYNKKSHSFTFGETIKASVILLLEFEDLPETARMYIAIKAIRQYVNKMVPSQTLNAFTQADEDEALSLMKEFEGDTGDYNIFDSYDTYAPLMRDH